MPRPHAVIYVPGLGDSRTFGQRLALSLWRLQGVEAVLHQVNWADQEPYAPKLQRLVDRIQSLRNQGKTVSLVGASAGGSLVLNAYATQTADINAVAAICGKLSSQGVGSVHPGLYKRNPAFLGSMQQLAVSEAALTTQQRSRILSLHPLADESVPISETRLAGSHQESMPVVGHFIGIAYGLTFGSRRILRFIRRQGDQHG